MCMYMIKKSILFLMLVSTIYGCRITRLKNVEIPLAIYVDSYIIPPLKGGWGEKHFKKTNLLELIFWNDTICSFKHTFFCSDIDEKYRVIEQKCRYFRKDSMIIVENIQYSGSEDLYIEIPIQESKKCRFLSANSRMSSAYFVYGRTVPNITVDTLYMLPQKNDMLILNSKNNFEILEDGTKIYGENLYAEFKKVFPKKTKRH